MTSATFDKMHFEHAVTKKEGEKYEWRTPQYSVEPMPYHHQESTKQGTIGKRQHTWEVSKENKC